MLIDEADFHLSGSVYKQNLRYWSGNFPNCLHKKPNTLNNYSLVCNITLRYHLTLLFKNDNGNTVTINAERYDNMLVIFGVPVIDEDDPGEETQDAAT